MAIPHKTYKSITSFKGLDTRSSDYDRSASHSSFLQDIVLDFRGALMKRPGLILINQSGENSPNENDPVVGFGLIPFDNVDPKTGIISKELISISSRGIYKANALSARLGDFGLIDRKDFLGTTNYTSYTAKYGYVDLVYGGTNAINPSASVVRNCMYIAGASSRGLLKYDGALLQVAELKSDWDKGIDDLSYKEPALPTLVYTGSGMGQSSEFVGSWRFRSLDPVWAVDGSTPYNLRYSFRDSRLSTAQWEQIGGLEMMGWQAAHRWCYQKTHKDRVGNFNSGAVSDRHLNDTSGEFAVYTGQNGYFGGLSDSVEHRTKGYTVKYASIPIPISNEVSERGAIVIGGQKNQMYILSVDAPTYPIGSLDESGGTAVSEFTNQIVKGDTVFAYNNSADAIGYCDERIGGHTNEAACDTYDGSAYSIHTCGEMPPGFSDTNWNNGFGKKQGALRHFHKIAREYRVTKVEDPELCQNEFFAGSMTSIYGGNNTWAGTYHKFQRVTIEPMDGEPDWRFSPNTLYDTFGVMLAYQQDSGNTYNRPATDQPQTYTGNQACGMDNASYFEQLTLNKCWVSASNHRLKIYRTKNILLNDTGFMASASAVGNTNYVAFDIAPDPVYYLIEEIPLPTNFYNYYSLDGTTKNYTVEFRDYLNVSALNAAAPLILADKRTGGAPSDCFISASYRGHLLLAGAKSRVNSIFYSDYDSPENFPILNSFDVEDPITGMAVIGHNLYIFQQNKIHVMNGELTLDNFTVIKIADGHGVGTLSHHAITEVEGELYFVNLNGVFAIDPSTNAIREVSSLIAPEFADKTQDAVNFEGNKNHLETRLTMDNDSNTTYLNTMFAHTDPDNGSNSSSNATYRNICRSDRLFKIFDNPHPSQGEGITASNPWSINLWYRHGEGVTLTDPNGEGDVTISNESYNDNDRQVLLFIGRDSEYSLSQSHGSASYLSYVLQTGAYPDNVTKYPLTYYSGEYTQEGWLSQLTLSFYQNTFALDIAGSNSWSDDHATFTINRSRGMYLHSSTTTINSNVAGCIEKKHMTEDECKYERPVNSTNAAHNGTFPHTTNPNSSGSGIHWMDCYDNSQWGNSNDSNVGYCSLGDHDNEADCYAAHPDIWAGECISAEHISWDIEGRNGASKGDWAAYQGTNTTDGPLYTLLRDGEWHNITLTFKGGDSSYGSYQCDQEIHTTEALCQAATDHTGPYAGKTTDIHWRRCITIGKEDSDFKLYIDGIQKVNENNQISKRTGNMFWGPYDGSGGTGEPGYDDYLCLGSTIKGTHPVSGSFENVQIFTRELGLEEIQKRIGSEKGANYNTATSLWENTIPTRLTYDSWDTDLKVSWTFEGINNTLTYTGGSSYPEAPIDDMNDSDFRLEMVRTNTYVCNNSNHINYGFGDGGNIHFDENSGWVDHDEDFGANPGPYLTNGFHTLPPGDPWQADEATTHLPFLRAEIPIMGYSTYPNTRAWGISIWFKCKIDVSSSFELFNTFEEMPTGENTDITSEDYIVGGYINGAYGTGNGFKINVTGGVSKRNSLEWHSQGNRWDASSVSQDRWYQTMTTDWQDLTGNDITDGEWHNIIVTCDKNQYSGLNSEGKLDDDAAVFVDGVRIFAQTGGTNIMDSDGDVLTTDPVISWSGNDPDSTSTLFNLGGHPNGREGGADLAFIPPISFDNIHVFSTLLTLDDAVAIYNNGIPGWARKNNIIMVLDPNCLAWWRFGEEPADSLFNSPFQISNSKRGNENLYPLVPYSRNSYTDFDTPDLAPPAKTSGWDSTLDPVSDFKESTNESILDETTYNFTTSTLDFNRAISLNHRLENLYLLYIPRNTNYSTDGNYNVAIDNIGLTDDLSQRGSMFFAYDYKHGAWVAWSRINCAGGLTYFNQNIYAAYAEGDDNFVVAALETTAKGDFDINDANTNFAIPIRYASHWESLGDPTTYKKFVRLKLYVDDSKERMGNMTLKIRQQTDFLGFVSDDSDDVAKINTFNIPSDMFSKSTKLKSIKSRSTRFIIEHESATEDFYFKGFELEVAPVYRSGEIRE